MSAHVELFRLSLTYRHRQPDMFVADVSREDYLRSLLDRSRRFTHYGAEFTYLPAASATTGRLMLGQIGKAVERSENAPPEAGFEEVAHIGWAAAPVVIDPRHHADGQKVGMVDHRAVGRPGAVLRSFVKALNDEDTGSLYYIDIEPIIDAQTFWDFVEAHRGDVTEVTFEFIAPNMFESEESVDQEMKELRKTANVRKMRATLLSDDGLDHTSNRIKQAVGYASRGTGSIRARTRTNQRYTSGKRPTRVQLDPAPPEVSLLQRMLAALKRIIRE